MNGERYIGDRPDAGGDNSLLEKVARVVGSTLEREELLRRLLLELNRAVPCDSLALFWREPGGSFHLTAAIGSSVVTEHVAASTGLDGSEERPQPFYSPENRSSAHPVLRWLGSRGLSSSLCVPVVVAQQMLGWQVASRAKPGSFTARDLHPLVQVALLTGPAVNSLRLYDRLEAAHKDLTAARDELSRSERLAVLGELASGVAHDINNILGLISARADLLKLQGLGASAEASIDAIKQAVDDGITMVRRMNQFTRRQRSREMAGLDLNQLVEEVLEMTRPRWQSSSSGGPGVRVRFRAGQTSTVMGVASELREVLVNLIMNAVDAMPTGGEITVESRQEDGWAVVSVADTGCGIPEDLQGRIFEPFFTTKGESGSGLGLWVSKGIVTRHGGDIRVESRPGQGSCFEVRLPVVTSIPAAPGRKPTGSGSSILVVDDEVGLGQALKLSLEMVGYRVTFSSRPLEALELFRREPFDLVITDLRMPVMTGWELAAEIKRYSPSTPIIAMTGWPVDLLRDGDRSSNMAVIIQKPYRVNELRAKVAELLSGVSVAL